MFGPPGHAYVFLLYGQHYHLNLVTGAVDQPEAVLVRAVEPLWGLEIMSTRRNVPAEQKVLTNGPGKLCQAFGIGKPHNGRDLTHGELHLSAGPAGPIGRSKRIGVDYAGDWAERPWRFYERGNRYVSGPLRSRS
jgi:DNA-3-methyladenine glycosylase